MKLNPLFFSLVLISASTFSYAGAETNAGNVVVTDAWTRASAPGQDVGAAYMTLTSVTDIVLTSADSPVAGTVEIHSMTMDNGVMKMRMLDTLQLPAGKPVKLTPGGLHLMLFDLKQPLKTGDSTTFTLHFADSKGKTSSITVNSPIKTKP